MDVQVALSELLVPILVSAVAVFIASSVIHMALPIHRKDYGKLPGEGEVMSKMREFNIAPGSYMIPCPSSMQDMASEEMQEKYKKGPVGFFTVLGTGPPAMAKNLLCWFLFCIAIGVFIGYIGSLSLGPGAAFMDVFRVCGTVGILGYAFQNFTDSIWKGVSWSITFKFVFDGIVYALVSAAVFGWMWPAGA